MMAMSSALDMKRYESVFGNPEVVVVESDGSRKLHATERKI